MMTRENVKKLLPIFQAFADGKTIQHCDDGSPSEMWRDAEELAFNDIPENYRIKPEPRRLYFIELKSGKLRLYGDCPPRLDAKTEDERWVEFVEVVDPQT